MKPGHGKVLALRVPGNLGALIIGVVVGGRLGSSAITFALALVILLTIEFLLARRFNFEFGSGSFDEKLLRPVRSKGLRLTALLMGAVLAAGFLFISLAVPTQLGVFWAAASALFTSSTIQGAVAERSLSKSHSV
jgi:hypothetical protein